MAYIDELLEVMRSLPPMPERIIYVVPKGFCNIVDRSTEHASLVDLFGVQVIESAFVDKPTPIPASVLEFKIDI